MNTTLIARPIRWQKISGAEKLLWVFFAINTLALFIGLGCLIVVRP